MGNEVDNKFTWVVKNFSSLTRGLISSEPFVLGGCRWRLYAYSLGLTLGVADYQSLSPGWRRHARLNLTFVHQNPEKSSKVNDVQIWFDQIAPMWTSRALVPIFLLDGGFIVKDELKIVVEVDVLEVIGKLDVSETATRPLKKIKVESTVSSDLHKGATSVKESMDVNGFQVLPSQAESVKRIFEKHPNIAVEVRAKNRHLRTACMNVLLNLIQTLCQPLQDLSYDDLVEANNALIYLKNSGFKVDWLEKKLNQVKEKKKEEHIGETRTLELEENLKHFKKKCSDIEAILEKEKEELKKIKQKCVDTDAMLEKEKAKVLALRAPPLTFDDVI